MSNNNIQDVKIIHFNAEYGGMHNYAELMKEGYTLNSFSSEVIPYIVHDHSYVKLFFEISLFDKNIVIDWFNNIIVDKNILIHFTDICLFIYPLIFKLTKNHSNTFIVTLHDPVPHGEKKFIKKIKNYITYFLNKWLCYYSYRVGNLYVHLHSEEQKITTKGEFLIGKHPISSESIEYKTITSCGDFEAVKFIFIGRLEYYKGVDLYVRAATKVLHKMNTQDTKFILAGKGDLNSQLEYKGLNVINEFIEEDRFNELIKSSHVVVLPYLNATQSGVLSRAIEFNKPVIISDKGELPNYVIDAKTGSILRSLTSKDLEETFIYYINNKHIIEYQSKNVMKLKLHLTSSSIVKKILTDLNYSKCY